MYQCFGSSVFPSDDVYIVLFEAGSTRFSTVSSTEPGWAANTWLYEEKDA